MVNLSYPRDTLLLTCLFLGFVLFGASGENDVVLGRQGGHKGDRTQAND